MRQLEEARDGAAHGRDGGVEGRGWPSITVCICTHARPGYLASCLDSLRLQTVGADSFEVVVVDSGSPAPAAAQIASLVAALPEARLVRLEAPGVAVARNAGVRAAQGDYVAFLDDDAIAKPDWVEQIRRVILEEDRPPAVLGGRVLPLWERPLPPWWPASLRGILSIVEVEGRGEYRTPDLPAGMAPWSVNMVVERAATLRAGGFDERLGRHRGLLLSDEDVQLAWRLQGSGRSARYDSRIVVRHCIQADRLSPEWLMDRLYWQGFSTVVTRVLMRDLTALRRELRRRLVVEVLCSAASLLPRLGTRLVPMQWRLAYAKGFTRAALNCVGGKRARLRAMLLHRLGRLPAQAMAPTLLGGALALLGEPGLDLLAAQAMSDGADRPATTTPRRDPGTAC